MSISLKMKNNNIPHKRGTTTQNRQKNALGHPPTGKNTPVSPPTPPPSDQPPQKFRIFFYISLSFVCALITFIFIWMYFQVQIPFPQSDGEQLTTLESIETPPDTTFIPRLIEIDSTDVVSLHAPPETFHANIDATTTEIVDSIDYIDTDAYREDVDDIAYTDIPEYLDYDEYDEVDESLQPVHPPASPPVPRSPIMIRERGKIYRINPDLPKICIIVDDFGFVSSSLYSRFLTLDRNVAFAFLPGYSSNLSNMKKAHEQGRELLLHIPMEPENPNERLEVNTIMTDMPDERIYAQIQQWIADYPLVIGANNHMGSRATTDERVMNITLSALKENNLFFIDSQTASSPVTRTVARNHDIRTIYRDIFLDVPDSSNKTARNHIDYIKTLKNKKVIVIITHCHTDIKFRQLTHFIDRLKDSGYEIIPPSKAINL
jgi:hypothetical protein